MSDGPIDVTKNIFGKPRDPKRIPDVLKKIQAIWEKHPQLRLGQLLGNTTGKSELKLYYIEDEDLLERLEKLYVENPLAEEHV